MQGEKMTTAPGETNKDTCATPAILCAPTTRWVDAHYSSRSKIRTACSQAENLRHYCPLLRAALLLHPLMIDWGQTVTHYRLLRCKVMCVTKCVRETVDVCVWSSLFLDSWIVSVHSDAFDLTHLWQSSAESCWKLLRTISDFVWTYFLCSGLRVKSLNLL